ncbi:MAG: PIN domain-containing protein [Spirochaetia bacterium]|nr:PIN domain-containing protein [Spirochaetia bacterium]
MKSVLVDAGPIIALFDSRDRHHAGIKAVLTRLRCRLVTTWPALTEAFYLLSNATAHKRLLEWMRRGGLEIFQIESAHLDRFEALMEKYANVPMDLADASLIVAAEAETISEIITIDSDFHVYRVGKKLPLKNLYARGSFRKKG